MRTARDESEGVQASVVGAPGVSAPASFDEITRAVECVGEQRTAELRTANEALRAEVAERKKTEENAGLIRALLDQSNDAIEVVDVGTGRYLDVNEKACQERGYDRAEYLAMTVFDMDAELDRASYAAQTEQLRRAGKMTLESWHRRKDGSRFPVEVSLSFVTRNRDYLVAIVRDITERKRAEAALREAESKYHSIFDNAVDGIFRSTAEGQFLAANPAMARILGYASIEELIQEKIGVPWLRCARPEEGARLKSIVEKQSEVVRLEYQTCRKSGEKIWVSENIRTMRDVNGHVCCYEGTLEDVTALKTMHTQLLKVSRQADMAEVATGVLHNVGNVFNSVNVSSTLVTEKLGNSHLGYLGKAVALLQEHEADLGAFLTNDPRGRQLPGYLGLLAVNLAKERESVVEEVELLRKNVDHIKDIISIQQGYAKMSGLVEVVRVTELIEDTLRMNSAGLARRDVEIVRDYDPQAPEIFTVKQKVLQILVNLVGNAKHACDASAQKNKRIAVSVKANEDGVRIAITDNGVGIPPENLSRVFEHGFTTRKNGHGFGLHSGALTARELGGALTAHSDGAGCGATFVLELPRQQA